MTMKHIIIIFSLFIGCASICAAPAYGEQESPFSNVNPSAQQAASGSSYSSTVYQPFSGTTPAEQSAGAMNSPTVTSGPHKSFVDRPDTPPRCRWSFCHSIPWSPPPAAPAPDTDNPFFFLTYASAMVSRL